MTLTTRAPAARSAFTLIELLVVIAIIGVLITIIGVALQKTVEGQRVRTTKDSMYKLQQSLDTEYQRVVQKCAKDALTEGAIPPTVRAYADNDPDRAKAIWTAMQLRQQLPESFTEAVTPVYITANNGVLVLRTSLTAPALQSTEQVIYTLTPLEVFKEFQANLGFISSPMNPPLANFAANVQGTGATPTDDERGALLYIILAKKSVSGGGAMASAADDLSQSTQMKVALNGINGGTSRELPAFADSWKGAVAFRRWLGTQNGDLPEVQSPPYLDAKLDIKTNPNANRDPIDPRNLVFNWTTAGAANVAKQAQMNASLGFTGANRTATVYSLGRFRTDPTDDIWGFRGRSFGK